MVFLALGETFKTTSAAQLRDAPNDSLAHKRETAGMGTVEIMRAELRRSTGMA